MAKFINVDSLLISPILPQVLSWMFAWLGQRYLWHIPQRDAEYSSEMIQQKEISFPDLEKQNKQKNMFDINAASESFKHKFLDVHRCLLFCSNIHDVGLT